MLPLLPAPKLTAGGVKLLFSLVQHCQIPKAEQGTPSDTCPFKTIAGFAVRENPPSLSCPQDQTYKEGCWKIFLSWLLAWDPLDISFNRHVATEVPSVFPGICMQYIAVVVSIYRTLVCHTVTEKLYRTCCKPDFWEILGKDAYWHGWLDQAHPLQAPCRPERCTYIAKKKITTMSEPKVTWFSLNFFLPTFHRLLLKEEVYSMESCIKQNSVQKPYLYPTTC